MLRVNKISQLGNGDVSYAYLEVEYLGKPVTEKKLLGKLVYYAAIFSYNLLK